MPPHFDKWNTAGCRKCHREGSLSRSPARAATEEQVAVHAEWVAEEALAHAGVEQVRGEQLQLGAGQRSPACLGVGGARSAIQVGERVRTGAPPAPAQSTARTRGRIPPCYVALGACCWRSVASRMRGATGFAKSQRLLQLCRPGAG